MFKSSMTASELIRLAADAGDICPAVDTDYYLLWLNSFESTLYTGVIGSVRMCECPVDGGCIDPADICVSECAGVRVCDVVRIFSQGRELTHLDAAAAAECTDRACFFAEGSLIRLRAPFAIGDSVTVVFRERPVRKTAENMHSELVALPDEFVPMALDYLAGCAFALACEDTQAANRFARYDAQLSDFVSWMKGGQHEV